MERKCGTCTHYEDVPRQCWFYICHRQIRPFWDPQEFKHYCKPEDGQDCLAWEKREDD